MRDGETGKTERLEGRRDWRDGETGGTKGAMCNAGRQISPGKGVKK